MIGWQELSTEKQQGSCIACFLLSPNSGTCFVCFLLPKPWPTGYLPAVIAESTGDGRTFLHLHLMKSCSFFQSPIPTLFPPWSSMTSLFGLSYHRWWIILAYGVHTPKIPLHKKLCIGRWPILNFVLCGVGWVRGEEGHEAFFSFVFSAPNSSIDAICFNWISWIQKCMYRRFLNNIIFFVLL